MSAARPCSRVLAGLVVIAAMSCADDPIAPDASPGARFDITPVASASLDTLWLGETVQLSFTLANPAGRDLPHTKKSTWSSTNPAVASVDSTGFVTSVDTGRTLVIAEHKGRADTVLIVVRYPPEARALWVNRFEFSSNPTLGPGVIRTIMDRAARANLNIVYWQVRGQGDAFYYSNLEPCAVSLCGALGRGFPSWDPLAVAIQEAHARGIELHAWINAFPGWGSPNPPSASFCALLRPSTGGAPNHMLIANPNWAMVSSTGVRMTCANSSAAEYAYVSPGIAGARQHLAAVAADIARRYDVDGIHLDRIRYPGTSWSYDSESLAGLAAQYGRAPTHPINDSQWMTFRQQQVNAAVQQVFQAITAVKPRIVLSAAVWPIYNRFKWGWPSSSGLTQYLQDPRAWVAGGYLDVAAPMTYFNINATYCSYTLNNPDWACLLDDHMGGIDAAGRHTYIAVAANRTTAEIARQITHGRSKGVKGFAFYSYNTMQSGNRWTQLGDGQFNWKASVPLMPWKSGAQMIGPSASRSLSLFSEIVADDASPVDELYKEFEEEPSTPPDWVEPEPGA